MDVQQTLTNNPSLFSTFSNVILSCLRFIGWWIIRGLSWLTDAVETALYTIFQNLDLFSYKDIGLTQGAKKGLYPSLLPVFWALLTVGMVIVGFMLITNRLKSKANIPVNLMLIIVLVLGMPTILSTLNNITKAAVKSFNSDVSIMDDLIRANVYDLAYLDTQNFSAASVEKKNNFNAAVPTATMIDPMETMNFNKCDNTTLFKSQLNIDSNGVATVVETAKKNMFDIELLDKLYYRYKINWLVLFVSSITILVALLVIGIKTARNVFEITYSAYLMLFVAPLDITSGQRTKKIIEEIISLFGVVILTLVSLQLYTMAMTWAGMIPGLSSLIVQVGLSIGIIGGPNIVQKILGIDAGVGKELQSAAGALYMAGAAGRAIKGGLHTAGNVLSGVGKATAGAGIAGAVGAGGLKATASNVRDNFKKPPSATDGEYTILGNESRAQPVGVSSRLDTNTPLNIESGETSSLSGPLSPDPLDGSGAPPSDMSMDAAQATATQTSADTATASMPDGSVDSSTNEDAATVSSEQSGGMSSAPSASSGGSQNGDPPRGPEGKRVSRDDTIQSALGTLMGNTRPARGLKKYGENLTTAFHVGENSVNNAWDSYRNQEKPVPHVYAEPLDDNPKTHAASHSPDDIIDGNEERAAGQVSEDLQLPSDNLPIPTKRKGGQDK